MLFGDPIIRGWVTRAGRVLDAQIRDAWRWLKDRAGDRLPAEFEFQLADLGRCFYKVSPASPHQWLETLVREGLAEIIERRQGAQGYIRLRLLDPYQIAELRVGRVDPQAELPFLAEPDLVRFETSAHAQYTEVSSTPQTSAHAQCAEVSPQDEAPETSAQQSCAEVSPYHDAAGDARPALLAALRTQLGAERTELWFGGCTFLFEPEPQCLAPNEFTANWIRQHFRHQLQAAAVECGLAGFIVLVGGAPAAEAPGPARETGKLQSAETSAAQQQELVRSSSRASNQPTNQRAGDSGEEGGDESQILRRAAELYARIGDPTLYRWVAIATVLLVDDGHLTTTQLDDLIEAHRYDFGETIKVQMGPLRWPKQGSLKSRLRAQGIAWKRQWERGSLPRSAPERENLSARRPR